MTIDARMRDTIGPLVGDRVAPGSLSFNTERPYVIYEQVGGKVIQPVEARHQPGLRNARMQVTVWADSQDEARALIEGIEVAMRAELLASPLGAAINRHEPDLRRYGFQQDFTVWY